jgi:eukaryotic-like serine/threonine-protein kinase
MSTADAPQHERYSVVRRLGEGGMGVVYEALDRKSGSRIALKTIRAVDPSAVYRFKREFRALADVTHPNLVTLHDLVLQGDQLFFTMELIEGVDFLQHVRFGAGAVFDDTFAGTFSAPDRGALPISAESTPRREAPRDLHRLVDATRQLVAGVGALHVARRLHRDIKPSNIRVCVDGRVVLLDFGLVAELAPEGAYETVEQICGTAEYMSPEQAAGVPLTEASDWYSVGVVLFQTLTGTVPFTGSRARVIVAKNELDAPRASELASGVPEDLDDLCADLLRRDPASRPDHREIMRRLGVSLQQRALVTQPADVIAGSRASVAPRLEAELDTMDAGRHVLMLLHGAAGMGKTTLLKRVLMRWASRRDAVFLAGRCYERDAMPFKAIDSVVDALSRHLLQIPAAASAARVPNDAAILSRMFPVLRRVPAIAALRDRAPLRAEPAELRRRAFASLRELLGRIADGNRLVIWIDDMQWGDRDSVALISEILSSNADSSIAIVVSFRTEDGQRSPAVVALRQLAARADDAMHIAQVELEPLTTDDSILLASSLLERAGHTAAGAADVAREAGGVPFLVSELVRYRVETELQGLRRSVPRSSRVRLEDVVRDRLDALPDSAKLLLELVAIAGHPLLRDVAACAAPLSPEDERRVVTRLQAEHWIRTVPAQGGEALVMCHERIRECVAAIAADRAPRLHRCIADALEIAQVPDSEVIATHYLAAGDVADAARHASAAAASAESAFAFDRAVEWHHLAVEEVGLEPFVVAERRASLASALLSAGRSAEAGAEYMAASVGAPMELAFEWQRRGAEALLASGKLDEGYAALHLVLASVGVRIPTTRLRTLLAILLTQLWLRIRGLSVRSRPQNAISSDTVRRMDACWSTALGISLVDPLLAYAISGRGLLLALDAGDVDRASRALTHEIGNAASTSPARAEVVSRAAEQVASRAGPYARVFYSGMVGLHMYLVGRWTDAMEALELARQRFREENVVAPFEARTVAIFGAWTLFYLGRVREVTSRVTAMIEEASDRGDTYWATMARSGVLNGVWLAADNPERARIELEIAARDWPTRPHHLQHYYDTLARCTIDLYEDRAQEARERIAARFPELKRTFVLRANVVNVEFTFLRARIALACGDYGVAAREMRALRRSKLPCAVGMASVIEGAIKASAGRDAREQLAEAVRGFERSGMSLHVLVVKRARALIDGDRDGLVAADSAIAQLGIVRPDRWARVIAPGIGDGPA